MRFSTRLISGIALSTLALASPLPDSSSKDKRSFVERDGTNFTVFEHAATGAKIEFVTNSGICETTPGVNQYSGYLSVGTNMNMWFWLYVPHIVWNHPKTKTDLYGIALRHGRIPRRHPWQLGSMVDQAVQA